MSRYDEDEINVWPIVKKCLIVGGIIAACFIIGCNIVHKNDIQDFQVVQTPLGNTSIVSEGGFYVSIMPKIWTYRKVDTVYFSNEKDESNDNDGVKVRFQNKGEGDISCQVVYRLFNDDEHIKLMHQYTAGSKDRIEELLLAKLKDIVMEKASNITSSEAIEDREKLAEEIRKDYINNKMLMDIGIKVEQFSITKIDFDRITVSLFEAQQKADLQKKTAEAEKQNLVMQKERTVAEYDRSIAESKGKAEVEKIKQVTDAERVAQLATIEAQKKVDVEKLAKEEEIVKANKILELAEIDKKTEATKLEIIKLQADQKIASAKAKQQEIELSGAISESDRVKLEIEKETKIGVAKAIADGVSKMKLPETFIMGGGNSEGTSSTVETFFNLLNVQKARELNSAK